MVPSKIQPRAKNEKKLRNYDMMTLQILTNFCERRKRRKVDVFFWRQDTLFSNDFKIFNESYSFGKKRIKPKRWPEQLI